MQYKIKDLPKILRPREKLAARGEEALSDSELLAILLGSGYRGKNVKELASLILRRFTLEGLAKKSFKELVGVKGIGNAKACQIKAAFELAKRVFNINKNELPIINAPHKAVEQVAHIRKAKKENFVVIYLNARHQMIFKDTISIGSLSMSVVHPREVFQPAIEHSAFAVILVHNHPSGDPEPSEHDMELTNDLVKAGDLLGIQVLDHIIVTDKKFTRLGKKQLKKNENP